MFMLRSIHRILHPGTAMAKLSKKSRRNKASPRAVELAPRLAPRRASAEWRMRILERLPCGLTVAHIARLEKLTVHRVRQIIAGMLEERELARIRGLVVGKSCFAIFLES